MASSEYISREAAEKVLSQPVTMSMCLTLEECKMKNAQRQIDLFVIRGLPAADVRPRWIPVTEQLIHSGWYLVACNEWGGSAVRKAIYDEATRKWLEFPCGGPKDITKFVTHYMPLPEPPKEEKDKND